MARRAIGDTACLDGGRRHAWKGTGLDTVGCALVHTGRCVWCGKDAARECTATSTPIRDGVRARA